MERTSEQQVAKQAVENHLIECDVLNNVLGPLRLDNAEPPRGNERQGSNKRHRHESDSCGKTQKSVVDIAGNRRKGQHRRHRVQKCDWPVHWPIVDVGSVTRKALPCPHVTVH